LKILLDTNIILFWLADSTELTLPIKKLIQSTENTLFYSALTIWEIEIKVKTGKLRVQTNYLSVLKSKDVYPLPFSISHATATRNLPQHHRDPFDRGLIATAISEKLTFLTTDTNLAPYGPNVKIV
jgi:PIN domain nuclease of toxin-antitoxin system